MDIKSFHNKYKNKPVFLIGNGPSLSETPLDLLKGMYSFAMNRISLMYDRVSWRPSFFICTSTNIAREEWRRDIIKTMTLGTPSFVWDRLKQYIEPYNFKNVSYINCTHGEKVVDSAPDEWWSYDASQRVCKFGTSMLPALQIAIYMGFNPIYLLGCDLGFKPPIQVIDNSKMPYDVANQVLKDPNHFASDYGTPGCKPDILNTNMQAAHNLSRRAAEKIGVQIYNATIGGDLNVYPRVDLRKLLSSIPSTSRKVLVNPAGIYIGSQASSKLPEKADVKINLIDVGSVGGPVPPWAANQEKIEKRLTFEPRGAATASDDTISISACLWDKAEERNFYIYRGLNGTGSSLFMQNYDYVLKNFESLKHRGSKALAETWLERSLPEDVERIHCRTLDDVLGELNLLYPFHFLKIDAQGAEYQILKGGEKYLRNDCYGLQLELFVLPLYKGIGLLDEITSYLDKLGFEMVKRYPAQGSFASQHECVFLRRGIGDEVMQSIRRIYDLPALPSTALKYDSDAASVSRTFSTAIQSGSPSGTDFHLQQSKEAADRPNVAAAAPMENSLQQRPIQEQVLKRSRDLLAEFQNHHRGQRCVIIGNGPSLNKMDLSFLKNEITFGMNRIYLLFDKWDFRPTYYVSVNPLVIEQSAEEICKITSPKFLSLNGLPYIRNHQDIIFLQSIRNPSFSRDPRNGLWEGHTVTYVAMQLAYFMGFSEVILIGVDHYFKSQGPANKEVISEGDDQNHFHPHYFGKGVRWHLPDLAKSEVAYSLAKQAFEADSRRIVDATVDGHLTIFPKADYKQIFLPASLTANSGELVLNAALIDNEFEEYVRDKNENLNITVRPKFDPVVHAEPHLEYLVSAIVSTYNSERFLRGCLDDLEQQTIADKLEIIVVNSGSQENEEAIVREFQQRYDNIKYIKTEQQETLYTAWNRAIQAARGKFITTANTDDRHRKDAFEALSDALREYPDVSLVYGDCYVSTKSNENYEENSKYCIYHYPEFLAVDAILFYQFGPQPMWRKNVHETIGYFDESYKAAGDHDFNIRFSMYFKALHIDEPLGLYLKHSEAISFKDNTMKQEQQRIVFDYRKPEIVEKLYRRVGITADTAEEKAKVFLDMGVRAMEYYPPWKAGRAEHHLEFAFQCFNKAAEFRPDWSAAYNNLAVVLGLSGNLGSAEKLLEKAADMTQDSTISFNLKLISDPLQSIQFSSGAKLLHSGLSLPSQKEVSLKRKLSESLTQTFLSLPQESIGNSMGLKVLFYFDRIGNFSQSSPAGTIMAICNFAKSLLRNKPDTRIYLTGDLVNYQEQYESFQVIPLPPPEQREQLITDYDVIFFATHVRYFKGLTKPSGQIWVLWQHCWEADDRVSLSHSSDFDAVICLSEQHRSSLRNKYFGDEKFITIPNLIDTNLYSPKGIIRNNHSIMFAGGLNPHKCVHILLDAFRLVRQQVKDAELHIYGDGKMWRGGDTYGNELKRIKPEGTFFHGYVDNKDMPQIYSKHSILCLPSKLESFGLVTVEAQACGCIPVVHNIGGVDATLADGETGLLYSPNTPEKLAETIIKALKIVDTNPSVRQKAVDFARNTYSMNRAAEYISQLWDKINIAKKVNTIRTLLKGNEVEKADLKCKELLQEYPNDPDVLLSQALIMLQQGNKTKANIAIEKLLENFPSHIRALNDFGLTAMKAGDTEKALRYLTKAYKFNPWDRDTVTNYYAMLKTSGRYRDAKKLLLNYLTNVGEDAQVLQLFREIDNLIANAGSGTQVVSQEVFNNRQDVHCESSESLPLVSIITPVYNGADYIGQTIESVLAQDYPNFELVIIDDGSTDNTKEEILRYNDGRIKYLYKENKGVSSARNLAISKAGGQYIMPLDADDMMTPDSITRHLTEFEKHPDADLVYCDVLLIDDRSNPIRIMNKPEYQDRRHLIRDLFRAGHPILPFRLGIRRSVFDKIGFYDEDLLIGEDYDMMRRFIKAGLKPHHLNKPLHLRRICEESLSRNLTPQKAKCHFDVIRQFTNTFTYEELFPDVDWDEIPADKRRLQAKCLAVVTYLAIGQDYSQSNSARIYAKTAFEQACLELRECLEIDPNNRQIRDLLQKCELGRQRYEQHEYQAVC